MEDKIGYGIPGFDVSGKPFFHFAAYKKHMGFYATPNGHEKIEKEFSKYKQGKNSVQFSLSQEIPYDGKNKNCSFSQRKFAVEYDGNF